MRAGWADKGECERTASDVMSEAVLSSLCTPRDLNPEPTVSSSAEIAEASKSSSVVRMIPRTTPAITREADAEVIALHGRRVEGVEAR